jgi:hypothetical protein
MRGTPLMNFTIIFTLQSPTFMPVIVTKVRDVYFWMLRTSQEYGWNKKVQPMILMTHCCLSNQDRSEKK